ncbi:MAG: glycine zipper 2TM domain-containing protein [Sulfurimicrobium sp.]
MKQHIVLLLVAAFLSCPAFAADTSAKSQYTAAKKAAVLRYADDKKLCADESSSSARMQCLRDAKAEYDKALADAKSEYAATSARSGKVCADCGKVLSVRVVEKQGESSPVGIVAGGVAGALLGHQVGGGSGKDLATIAGAAGGAYAGHKIEQKIKTTKVWEVAVRFENGDEKTFTFDKDPGFATGSAVKASNGSIVHR